MSSPSPPDQQFPDASRPDDVSFPPPTKNPAEFDSFDDPALSHLPELTTSHLRSGRRPPELRPRIERRVMMPVLLFIATCLSTFWVAASQWDPTRDLGNWQAMAVTAAENWQQGLIYMGAVLAILVAHEMGHFIQTVRYHVPASYPLCIPLPINPFGTMGAVIGMDGTRANRREIFDIGIAGPLAGLVVAIPVMYLGVADLELGKRAAQVQAGAADAGAEEILLNNPWVVQWMIAQIHPEWADQAGWIALSQIATNPLFMAGWVGMLITGLNMMPISQLDGGHTIYALFGKDAHLIARAFTVFAILFIVLYLDYAFIWTPMLVLVLVIGIHHPPTADDSVELGPWRRAIGYASLGIPILCFPLLGFRT